jgi:hypothetical protein
MDNQKNYDLIQALKIERLNPLKKDGKKIYPIDSPILYEFVIRLYNSESKADFKYDLTPVLDSDQNILDFAINPYMGKMVSNDLESRKSSGFRSIITYEVKQVFLKVFKGVSILDYYKMESWDHPTDRISELEDVLQMRLNLRLWQYA